MGPSPNQPAAATPLALAARAIVAELERGLALDPAEARLLEQVTGARDAATAARQVLAGRDTAELAPLAQLLFSPDRAAMARLEPALAALDETGAAGPALAEELGCLVVAALAQGGRRAWLLLPGAPAGSKTPKSGWPGPGSSSPDTPVAGKDMAGPGGADGLRLDLCPEPGDILGFVRRLRPGVRVPAELTAVLARLRAQGLDAALALALAVRLRHAGLAWTPVQVFFLAALLERAGCGAITGPGPAGGPDAGGEMLELLAWALGFAAAHLAQGAQEGGGDLRPVLARQRQALLAQLRQAERQEEALARGNYETLMAQGMRLAHVHGPDIRAELACLDRASALVLGLRGQDLEVGGVHRQDLGLARSAAELLGLLPGPED